jgi:hypothetical protein
MEKSDSSMPMEGASTPLMVPLSSGLGLGTLRPVTQPKTALKKLPDSQLLNSSSQHPPLTREPQQKPISQIKSTSPNVTSKWNARPSKKSIPGRSFAHTVKRWLLMVVIDASFIFVNIVVGILGACLAFYLKGGKPDSVFDLYPVSWLLAQSPTRIVCGLVAVYIVYVLAFLLLVGSTVGSMSVALEPRKVQK